MRRRIRELRQRCTSRAPAPRSSRPFASSARPQTSSAVRKQVPLWVCAIFATFTVVLCFVFLHLLVFYVRLLWFMNCRYQTCCSLFEHSNTWRQPCVPPYFASSIQFRHAQPVTNVQPASGTTQPAFDTARELHHNCHTVCVCAGFLNSSVPNLKRRTQSTTIRMAGNRFVRFRTGNAKCHRYQRRHSAVLCSIFLMQERNLRTPLDCKKYRSTHTLPVR